MTDVDGALDERTTPEAIPPTCKAAGVSIRVRRLCLAGIEPGEEACRGLAGARGSERCEVTRVHGGGHGLVRAQRRRRTARAPHR
jgi:hypothetical protein